MAEMDARQLTAAGFDVTVITPMAKGDDSEHPFPVRRIRPVFRYGNAGFCPQLRGIWREFDLVILHYPFYGGAEPLVWGKPKGNGAKLAVMYHMDTVGSGLIGRIFSAHRRLVMPWVLGKADVIIGTTDDYLNSSHAAPVIRRLGLRVRELPPSVDTVRFRPSGPDRELLERHGLVRGDRTVLFVGGLDRAHYFKGIPYLMRALTVRSLDGVKAVIVGQGEMRGEYGRLAESLGLADRVIFAGGVGEGDLARYYRLADAFVFPSVDRSEAFGIAVLEALASGVPAVASDLPGVRTIVRDGETGYRFRPRSVSDLAVRLSLLLDDDEDRIRLGRNARQVAVSEYSDAVRSEKLADIVRETAESVN